MISKVKKLYVEEFKGFKNFTVKINERTTVLIGENGTGKTTLLEIIYNILAGNEQFFSSVQNFKSVLLELKDNTTIKFVRNNNRCEKYINDKQIEEESDFFKMHKVLYFPTEVAFKNYEVTGAKKMDIEDKDIMLTSEKMSRELKQFLVNEKYQDLNDIANGNIENANRIDRYKRIYNAFLKDKKFVGIDNESFEPIFELNDTKEQITIDKLSSGEKQIFYRAGSLIQYGDKKDIIVLIDEPEISMHPEWQQKILVFYENINPKAQFIFATHSPHIVSACKGEEIRVIVKKDNSLIINEDIINTYGQTNEEILFNIFNLNSVRDLDVQKEMDEYKRLFSKGEQLSEEEKNQMIQLKEKLEATVGLSKSDIAILEFESNTNRFKEMAKKLEEK